MKKINYIQLTIIVLIGITACNDPIVPDYEYDTAFQINIGSLGAIYLDDIKYYDAASHIFYLNKDISFDLNENLISFWITSNEDVILQGIYTDQPFTSNYAFLSKNKWDFPELLFLEQIICWNTSYQTTENIIDNSNMLSLLKENNRFMNGLQVSLASAEIIDSSHVNMTLEIYNPDTISYYYPDVEKIGIENYYTLGENATLLLIGSDSVTHTWDTTNETNNTWDNSGLSKIDSEETQTMSFDYENFDSITTGTYTLFFKFYGLTSQITNYDDMELDDGRIWLGHTDIVEEILLE